MNKEDLQAISDLLDMKLKPLQSDIKDLKDGQNRIEKKLDAVYDQTADLTEFRTETKDKLNNISNGVNDIKDTINTVEVVTSKNWNDIAKLKAVK